MDESVANPTSFRPMR